MIHCSRHLRRATCQSECECGPRVELAVIRRLELQRRGGTRGDDISCHGIRLENAGMRGTPDLVRGRYDFSYSVRQPRSFGSCNKVSIFLHGTEVTSEFLNILTADCPYNSDGDFFLSSPCGCPGIWRPCLRLLDCSYMKIHPCSQCRVCVCFHGGPVDHCEQSKQRTKSPQYVSM